MIGGCKLTKLKRSFFIGFINFTLLLERSRCASAPGSERWSERRSGLLARSAVGAPLRKKAGALVGALALRQRSSKQ